MIFAHDSQVLFPQLWRDEMPWLTFGCSTAKFPTGAPAPEGSTREALALLHLLGINVPLLRAWQKHTNTVAVASTTAMAQAQRDGYYMWTQTDAIICPPETDAACVVYTADCVPILIADARTRAVAAIHSGWRGTITRIVDRTIREMIALGSRPQDLRAWIGPCASGRRYEVSEELIAQFRTEFVDADRNGVQYANGRLLNLPALVCYQLHAAGLSDGAVINSDICTIENADKFPSYRRRVDADDDRRIISFIYSEPQATNG